MFIAASALSRELPGLRGTDNPSFRVRGASCFDLAIFFHRELDWDGDPRRWIQLGLFENGGFIGGTSVLTRNLGWTFSRCIKIKGPDSSTRQLLPIMSTTCCSGDGERRKDKGCGGGPTSKTKLCVTKLYVKDGVRRRKMVCVTKLCVKDGVCESCVWKRACDKVAWARWCVTKWCVKDGVAKDGVWQSCVWKMVWWKMVCDKVMCERWCVTKWCVKDGVVKDGVWQSGVCGRWCVTKLCVQDEVWQSCVKDGMWQSRVWKMVCDKVVCDKVVCERWCVTKLCVTMMLWRREAGGGGEPGIQNQKQEPHTKMWGKKK